jgi:hypothetical protein
MDSPSGKESKNFDPDLNSVVVLKGYPLTVTKAEKDFIEQNILFLISKWGLDHLRTVTILNPDQTNIPSDLRHAANFRQLNRWVADQIGTDSSKLSYRITTIGDTLRDQEGMEVTHPALIAGHSEEWPHKMEVKIHQKNLKRLDCAIVVLAVMHLHIRFAHEQLLELSDNSWGQPLLGVSLIFKGFGAFVCSSIGVLFGGYTVTPAGVSLGMAAYTVALALKLANKDPKEFKNHFSRHVYANILQNHVALMKGVFPEGLNETSLNSHLEAYKQNKAVFEANWNSDYNWLINFYHTIEQNSKNQGSPLEISFAMQNLGFYLVEAGQFERAIVQLDKVIDLFPQEPFPLNNRGYAKMMLGQMESAWEDFIQSQKLDHFNGWLYRNKGIWLLKQGRPAEALEQLTLSHTLDLHVPKVYLHMSEAHRALGDLEQAETFAARHAWFEANHGHQPLQSL